MGVLCSFGIATKDEKNGSTFTLAQQTSVLMLLQPEMDLELINISFEFFRIHI
jgi:hypothetical protein